MRRLTWISVAVLAICCATLAVLQYRWIGEIGNAERDRLRGSLRTRLNALARAFDSEVSAAAMALVPSRDEMERLGREEAWRTRFSHSPFFNGASVSWDGGGVALESGGGPDAVRAEVFGQPYGPEWLLLNINRDYVQKEVLPRLLNLYVGEDGVLDYDAEVTANGFGNRVIFGNSDTVREHADASVPLLNLRLGGGFGPDGRGRGRGPGPPPPGGRQVGRRGPPGRFGPGSGEWLLSVRHHAGSLEALVSGTQRRSLAISGSVLLLILATCGLLLHLSRQAQRLADLQIEFVAGVSHELRTPLTVIRTAAYNLRAPPMRERPDQVERYGRLIESESARLETLMEQVLRFASLRAGDAMRGGAPVSLAVLAREEIDLRQPPDTVIEARLDDPLPHVAGDAGALRHAVRNLIDNGLKHGARGKWLGVYARHGDGWAELVVADHGPGIPPDEQTRIFDAFYRGSGALREQVHGTGLGLNLVKTIVKAHGGTVRVKSDGVNGAEFTIRLPEYRNDDTHPAG